jgi:hypothetical protein
MFVCVSFRSWPYLVVRCCTLHFDSRAVFECFIHLCFVSHRLDTCETICNLSIHLYLSDVVVQRTLLCVRRCCWTVVADVGVPSSPRLHDRCRLLIASGRRRSRHRRQSVRRRYLAPPLLGSTAPLRCRVLSPTSVRR